MVGQMKKLDEVARDRESEATNLARELMQLRDEHEKEQRDNQRFKAENERLSKHLAEEEENYRQLEQEVVGALKQKRDEESSIIGAISG